MKIKCAAILYKDNIYEGEDHHTIGLTMLRDGVCTKPYPGGDDQGFVTDTGRYVHRDQALKIAIRAEQVKEGHTIHHRHLFSEDLNQTKSIRITTLKELRYMRNDKRSVVVPGYNPWKKPRPAAFMIQLSGEILLRLFDAGMYVYKKKGSS